MPNAVIAIVSIIAVRVEPMFNRPASSAACKIALGGNEIMVFW